MADLQRRLKEEFDLNLTYMDTRFMSLDLGLEFKVEETPVKEETPEETPLEDLTGDDVEVIPPTQGATYAPVTVTVDQITRPGAMVSGKVNFSDGEKGMWLIDNQGRPSIDPDTAGYRPSEADLMEFQQALREALEGHM